MTNEDVLHFTKLGRKLTRMREELPVNHGTLRDQDRDLVAIAQAEALASIAASLHKIAVAVEGRRP